MITTISIFNSAKYTLAGNIFGYVFTGVFISIVLVAILGVTCGLLVPASEKLIRRNEEGLPIYEYEIRNVKWKHSVLDMLDVMLKGLLFTTLSLIFVAGIFVILISIQDNFSNKGRNQYYYEDEYNLSDLYDYYEGEKHIEYDSHDESYIIIRYDMLRNKNICIYYQDIFNPNETFNSEKYTLERR